MNNQWVLENLCVYNPLNPNYLPESIEYAPNVGRNPNQCFCDNCFYGRNELALEIIELQKIVNVFQANHNATSS